MYDVIQLLSGEKGVGIITTNRFYQNSNNTLAQREFED